jgi:hypothetical protein
VLLLVSLLDLLSHLEVLEGGKAESLDVQGRRRRGARGGRGRSKIPSADEHEIWTTAANEREGG